MVLLNKIAFTIFGRPIYWYGIIISLAIVTCVVVAMILCKPKKINTSVPMEIFLAIIPLGIANARLFSVIFEEGLSIADYFDFETGGMSIIGAIIGGAIGALIYKLITKQKILKITDIITSVLLLGQSIGRWGNYLNGELYGQEVVNASMQFFPFSVNIGGTWYEALFFYESMLTLIGFIVLLIVYLKTKKHGICTGAYLCYYGFIRILLESRRQQQYILKWGSIPVSTLFSSLFIVIGASILIYVIVKHIKEKKETKKVG